MSGSLALASWYRIERACFSDISALSGSPTSCCGGGDRRVVGALHPVELAFVNHFEDCPLPCPTRYKTPLKFIDRPLDRGTGRERAPSTRRTSWVCCIKGHMVGHSIIDGFLNTYATLRGRPPFRPFLRAAASFSLERALPPAAPSRRAIQLFDPNTSLQQCWLALEPRPRRKESARARGGPDLAPVPYSAQATCIRS